MWRLSTLFAMMSTMALRYMPDVKWRLGRPPVIDVMTRPLTGAIG
jgi:hypothetical protein